MAISLRKLALITFIPIVLALSSADAPSFAQDARFRMPEYADEGLPPARSQADVDALLEGSDDVDITFDAKPLRIVLIDGEKDHGKGEHDYPAWLKVWAPLVAEGKLTTVDTAHDFPTEEQVDNADVLVFYQRGKWDDNRAAAIDPFLARGGGCVYIHWALDGQGGQDEFAKRIGLSGLGGTIKFRHGPLDMDFTPGKDHPIARNFDRVKLVDESYWALVGDRDKINLIATQEEEGEPQPQFWTVEHGRGRVFVSIPGHYMWSFDDPAFRLLLLRGIAWAGHRNVDRFNELITLDARIASEITVGQDWSQATAAAREADYELSDPSQLQMDPAPDGFYLNLPDDRGLLVERDRMRNVVADIHLYENWSRPKLMAHHLVKEFRLPDRVETTVDDQRTDDSPTNPFQ